MSFEKKYQQAMEKVQPSSTWKEQTRMKMQQTSSNKAKIVHWKPVVLPLAACFCLAVGVGIVFRNGLPSTEISTAGGQQDNTSSSVSSSPAVAQQNEPSIAAMPRTAMMMENPVALQEIAFSAEDIEIKESSDLPMAIELTAEPSSLPVWQETSEGYCFLGDYPVVSFSQTMEETNSGEERFNDSIDISTQLVYVESCGYLQPAYSFALPTEDGTIQYVGAISGEYYNQNADDTAKGD